MAITKGEYLAALQTEVEVTGQKRKKATKRKRIVALILGIGTLLLLGVGSIGTKIERATNFRRFSAGEIGASFEMLSEAGVFDVWNEQNLGNDINTLLGGGKLYARNGLTVLPLEEGYSVAKNGQIIGYIPGSISYINATTETIYYRDDATRSICSFSILNGSIATVIDSNVGEVLLSGERLYYVDRKNGSTLSVASLDGSEQQIVVDQPVTSFVVCGDDIIFLDPNQTLYRRGMDDTSATTLMPKTERFFIHGNIIVESGNSIFRFTAEKSNASLIYQSSAADMQLVGAYEAGIFYQEDGKLLLSQEGKEPTVVFDDGAKVYQSVLVDETGTVRCLGLFNLADAKLLETTVPELKGVDQHG